MAKKDPGIVTVLFWIGVVIFAIPAALSLLSALVAALPVFLAGIVVIGIIVAVFK